MKPFQSVLFLFSYYTPKICLSLFEVPPYPLHNQPKRNPEKPEFVTILIRTVSLPAIEVG